MRAAKSLDGIVEAIAEPAEPAVVTRVAGEDQRLPRHGLRRWKCRRFSAGCSFRIERVGTTAYSRWTCRRRRGDITRDVDLIEEVARLYGYDNIPTTPIEGVTTPGALTKPQAIRRELRKRADGRGPARSDQLFASRIRSGRSCSRRWRQGAMPIAWRCR